MYDSTGKQRGTFTVQDNKVVATYTDTTDASSGINAYVTIDGKITRSADNNGNGGNRDWNFPKRRLTPNTAWTSTRTAP